MRLLPPLVKLPLGKKRQATGCLLVVSLRVEVEKASEMQGVSRWQGFGMVQGSFSFSFLVSGIIKTGSFAECSRHRIKAIE